MSGSLVEPTDPTELREIASRMDATLGRSALRAAADEIEQTRRLLGIGAQLDNHHNADVCPYCTHTTRAEIERLRAERVTIAKDTLNQAVETLKAIRLDSYKSAEGTQPGFRRAGENVYAETWWGGLGCAEELLEARAAALGDAEPVNNEDDGLALGKRRLRASGLAVESADPATSTIVLPVGDAEPTKPTDDEQRCGLCGHRPTDHQGARGLAGSVTLGEVEIKLCHEDDHSCYHRWTVYGDRPGSVGGTEPEPGGQPIAPKGSLIYFATLLEMGPTAKTIKAIAAEFRRMAGSASTEPTPAAKCKHGWTVEHWVDGDTESYLCRPVEPTPTET